jgi:acetyltransferase
MDMATATAHAARLDVAEPAASADDGRHVWAARDGTPILVRAITPDDFQLEREFVEGLSPQAGYQRLMSSRKPSAEELQRWTVVDREREGALIATTSGHGRERQVGVARYAMDAGDDAAEFAVVRERIHAAHGPAHGFQAISVARGRLHHDAVPGSA